MEIINIIEVTMRERHEIRRGYDVDGGRVSNAWVDKI